MLNVLSATIFLGSLVGLWSLGIYAGVTLTRQALQRRRETARDRRKVFIQVARRLREKPEHFQRVLDDVVSDEAMVIDLADCVVYFRRHRELFRPTNNLDRAIMESGIDHWITWYREHRVDETVL